MLITITIIIIIITITAIVILMNRIIIERPNCSLQSLKCNETEEMLGSMTNYNARWQETLASFKIGDRTITILYSHHFLNAFCENKKLRNKSVH